MYAIATVLLLAFVGAQKSPEFQKDISVEFKATAAEDAVKDVFAKTGAKLRIEPGLTDQVTLIQAKVNFRLVLREVLLQTNGTYDRVNGTYVVRPMKGPDNFMAFADSQVAPKSHAKNVAGYLRFVEYYEADVQLVLRELFAQAGKKYTCDPKLEGVVTMSVSKMGFDALLSLALRQVDGAYRISWAGYEVFRVKLDPPF